MDKLLSLLGLCRRAGRLEAGFIACQEAARTGKAALIAAASDVSEKTCKNLKYEAERAGIHTVRLKTDMCSLSHACGVKAGVVAVTDKGFAQAILKEYGKDSEREKEE